MSKKAETKPEEKRFDLKPIEQQMLTVFEQQYFTMLSNFLSFIALERLAYKVTPQTQFRVQEGALFIHEAAADEKPEEVAVA